MKIVKRKETSELAKAWKWVDVLLSAGFILGVALIIVLFFYVLFTQILAPQ